MPKLVDADKLKAHYAWWDNEDKKIFDTIIDLQPDAVVRCKDCRYRNNIANCERFGRERYVQANSYCSWAERRL